MRLHSRSSVTMPSTRHGRPDPPSKDRTIRMTALRAFLSLVFITSVLAMAINVVSGLFGE